ncbi:MAG: DUF421 domain-containing protein [Actinomycetota bacterium]|nr:DUF421 domain-containing protein [Actinomycetota bacterium]
MHRVVSVLRCYPVVRRVTDHRIRILVDHGRIRRRQMRVCGLTEADLQSGLRQQGFASLDDIRLVPVRAGWRPDRGAERLRRCAHRRRRRRGR